MINWKEIQTFSSKKEAHNAMMKYVEAGILETDGNKYWPSDPYHLKNGEYSRPVYTIRKRQGRNEWYVHVKSYFYNANDGYTGPVGALWFSYLDRELAIRDA